MTKKKDELKRVMQSLAGLEGFLKDSNHPGAQTWIKDLGRAQRDVEQSAIYRAENKNYKKIYDSLKEGRSNPPSLPGIDMHGKIIPLYEIGGDNFFYIDFAKDFSWPNRFAYAESELNFDIRQNDVIRQMHEAKKRVAYFINDVEGHQNTDAVISWVIERVSSALIQAELRDFGHVTSRWFEELNMDLYRSISIQKTTTGLYTEIHSDGTVRFISAAHPLPMVFSYAKNAFVPIADVSGRPLETSTALGFLPSKNHFEASKYPSSKKNDIYVTNEIVLQGRGDILIAFTDGVSEYELLSGERYLHTMFEKRLQEWKDLPAKDICDLFEKDFRELNPDRGDDITIMVTRYLP
jgi:serine phosphatase RsbU (regulator of sigma subunit)